MEAPEVKPLNPLKINVTVRYENYEVDAKIWKHGKMDLLMNKFCKSANLEKQKLRFIFDGRRILPEQTAAEIGIEDGDDIDTYQEQCGGPGPQIAPVKIKVGHENFTIAIKIRKHVPLELLMNKFCKAANLEKNDLRFLHYGTRILPEQTAAELGIEDGDDIDAYQEQISG